MQAGYAFDFVSDAQLQRLTRERRCAHRARAAVTACIVVPATRRMSVETLDTAARAREARREACMFESLPQDVPGFGQLEARRAKLRALLDATGVARRRCAGDTTCAVELGVPQEQAPQAGLAHIRRARTDGYDYFFANLTGKAFDGWLQLGTPARLAMILDPLTGQRRSGGREAREQRQTAGLSTARVRANRMLVRTFSRRRTRPGAAAGATSKPAGGGHRIAGRVAVSSSSRAGPCCRAPRA